MNWHIIDNYTYNKILTIKTMQRHFLTIGDKATFFNINENKYYVLIVTDCIDEKEVETCFKVGYAIPFNLKGVKISISFGLHFKEYFISVFPICDYGI